MRRSKVCRPRPPASRLAKAVRTRLSSAWWLPIDWPTRSSRASSSVWRMASPPGTSPTPVLPALSFRMTILRVKNGPCAPDRFINMLSWPATGTTVSSVITGMPATGAAERDDWAMLNSSGKSGSPRWLPALAVVSVWMRRLLPDPCVRCFPGPDAAAIAHVAGDTCYRSSYDLRRSIMRPLRSGQAPAHHHVKPDVCLHPPAAAPRPHACRRGGEQPE